ncbi:capsular biosynthesis protein CpsJ [Oceanobacillus zhaokaii]|uniref:Capsular biosynthesis protein CpsJ n=1 Tax=Oceanobacillus zhaokaii TaxID=2052660 RepID=A0A345PL91_9BACI|nr:glycosyltransferase [Oceanobacillus zhaokaii]AXI10771.1 capsular biosynthesis protein CpsJ [Oceanobacillus zhaokaii]
MNPSISIIVPVYNVEQYIHKCIDSILAQSFKDFELIIVNDGSTDNGGRICDEYATLDNRITVFHKENGGLSSARNKGISLAKGNYIAFVDSDDFVHPKMYEILFNYVVSSSADIAICDYQEVNEDEKNEIEKLEFDSRVEKYNNVEALYQLYTTKGLQFVIACNKLFKSSLFNKIKFEEGMIHEDEFMAHRILYESEIIIYLPVKLYFYLQRKGSIINSKFNINRLDAVYAYKKRVDFFREINQYELQKMAEYNYVHLFFTFFFKVKDKVPNSKGKLKQVKSDFTKILIQLLKNPLFSKKEKILWIVYTINPSLFQLYVRFRNGTVLKERPFS